MPDSPRTKGFRAVGRFYLNPPIPETMPHSRSAKKRHRQSVERREKNRSVKHELKTRVRKVAESVKAGKLDEAKVPCALPRRSRPRRRPQGHPPQCGRPHQVAHGRPFEEVIAARGGEVARGQMSENRGQMSENRSRTILISDFCPLTSDP